MGKNRSFIFYSLDHDQLHRDQKQAKLYLSCILKRHKNMTILANNIFYEKLKKSTYNFKNAF